jgi:hypothetical protein
MEAKIDAQLEEMRVWRKETTACQEATDACPEKVKANQEKTKAGQEEMDVFEERLDKMDTMDLEASREKSEAISVHQEVPKDEGAVETIGALVDR